MPLPQRLSRARALAATQSKATFYSAVVALVEFIRRVRADGTQDMRPHFIHLDGHFSHFDEDALQLMLDNNIHPHFIPSHSSQELQSADCGLQACFKAVLKVRGHQSSITCVEASTVVSEGAEMHRAPTLSTRLGLAARAPRRTTCTRCSPSCPSLSSASLSSTG